MKKLAGWGQFPKIETKEVIPNSEEELLTIIKKNESFIARGNGRSYGDSSINATLTINMTRMNKFLDWDQENGELIAESGVLIADIIEHFLPKGWFPYVTPGTKYVTLGGAIACNVHGKNHHSEGAFGDYVNWIELVNDSNEVIRCSKDQNSDLFFWSIGGMGLTGIILRCSIKLKQVQTGWIMQKIQVNNNLEETMKSFLDFQDETYSVAWLDCMAKGKSFGRSILISGEHAKKDQLKLGEVIYPKRKRNKFSLFFDMPSFVLNNFSVSTFNKFYFFINKKRRSSLINWDEYFYPLDWIKNWNKMYGKRGFFQLQCVLPNEVSSTGYKEIIQLIQQNSSGSFLAVIKKFGEGNGSLSFPREGFTLALDFKASSKNLKAAKQITELVIRLKGTIYLAKDALLNSEEFRLLTSQNLIDSFKEFKNTKLQSEQSKRIGL